VNTLGLDNRDPKADYPSFFRPDAWVKLYQTDKSTMCDCFSLYFVPIWPSTESAWSNKTPIQGPSESPPENQSCLVLRMYVNECFFCDHGTGTENVKYGAVCDHVIGSPRHHVSETVYDHVIGSENGKPGAIYSYDRFPLIDVFHQPVDEGNEITAHKVMVHGEFCSHDRVPLIYVGIDVGPVDRGNHHMIVLARWSGQTVSGVIDWGTFFCSASEKVSTDYGWTSCIRLQCLVVVFVPWYSLALGQSLGPTFSMHPFCDSSIVKTKKKRGYTQHIKCGMVHTLDSTRLWANQIPAIFGYDVLLAITSACSKTAFAK